MSNLIYVVSIIYGGTINLGGNIYIVRIVTYSPQLDDSNVTCASIKLNTL